MIRGGLPGLFGLLAMTEVDSQIRGQTKPIIMQTDAPGLTVVVCKPQGGLVLSRSVLSEP